MCVTRVSIVKISILGYSGRTIRSVSGPYCSTWVDQNVCVGKRRFSLTEGTACRHTSTLSQGSAMRKNRLYFLKSYYQ